MAISPAIPMSRMNACAPMGTNGFQEPPQGLDDNDAIIGTPRLYCDGVFSTDDGRARFMAVGLWRRILDRGDEGRLTVEMDKFPFFINNVADRISTGRTRFLDEDSDLCPRPLPYRVHRDASRRHERTRVSPRATSSRSSTTTARPKRINGIPHRHGKAVG